MSRRVRWVGFGFAVLLFGTGCMAPAPKVPFVSATEAQIDESRTKETWFEFHIGDEVPLAMLYSGVLESKTPIVVRAARPFWLIVTPNQPTRFSFDGKTSESSFGKAGVIVGHAKGTNFVGLAVYIGKPEDMPPEMK
jgi:hypothetical protein